MTDPYGQHVVVYRRPAGDSVWLHVKGKVYEGCRIDRISTTFTPTDVVLTAPPDGMDITGTDRVEYCGWWYDVISIDGPKITLHLIERDPYGLEGPYQTQP